MDVLDLGTEEGLETQAVAGAEADAGQGAEGTAADAGGAAEVGDGAAGGAEALSGEAFDGRKFSPEINSFLKTLREQFPTQAKAIQALRDGYGRSLAVSALAPKGAAEIQGWKTALEAAGGVGGVANIQNELNKFEQMVASLAKGDGAVFDREDLKGALPQVAASAIAKLGETNPQALEQTLTPLFAERLAGTGLDQALQAAAQMLDGGNLEGAKQALAGMSQWVARNSQSGGAPGGQGGAGGRQDPLAKERESLATERQQIEQQKNDAFWGGVNEKVTQKETAVLTAALMPYLKSLNLNDGQKELLMGDFRAEIARRAGADPAYQAQLKAYREQKNRNADGVTNYINAKLDAMAASVVKTVTEARYPGSSRTRTAASATATGARQEEKPAAASSGATVAIRVAEKPTNLDYERSSVDDLFYRRAWTKDGKFVTWPARQATA